ncbi:MHYT domain-containing protein [Paenisporosarcina sp. NPDC076898]|uniref:MHYT domain-containing protein n=1 Tax=unclassified Paenisporosarcina TaxID=2642018 RepID=UPI003D05F96B
MGNYNILLVLLSFIVILFTSFSVFDIAARMTRVSNRKRILWLIVGSLTMGAGALHFIGMLAFMMPATIHYNIMILSISLAVTLFSSFVTLLIVSQDQVNRANFVFGCFILATSFIGLQYIGMGAIHANATFTYHPFSILVSVLLAFISSIIFYKTIYDTRIKEFHLSIHTKAVRGILMALSISAMHYIAMYGTKFTYTFQGHEIHFQTVEETQLALGIRDRCNFYDSFGTNQFICRR